MGRIILIYIFPALIYLCRVRATCFLKSTFLLILCECKYVSCAFSVVSPFHDTECFQHSHRSDPPQGGSPPSPLQMVALFRTPLCIARVPSACALKALRWRSSCQSDPGARSRAKTLHYSWNEDALLVLLGSRVSQSWLWTGFFSFLPVILLFSSWGRVQREGGLYMQADRSFQNWGGGEETCVRFGKHIQYYMTILYLGINTHHLLFS